MHITSSGIESGIVPGRGSLENQPKDLDRLEITGCDFKTAGVDCHVAPAVLLAMTDKLRKHNISAAIGTGSRGFANNDIDITAQSVQTIKHFRFANAAKLAS